MSIISRASLHAVRKGENPNAQHVRVRIIGIAVYGERRFGAGRGVYGAHGRTITAWPYSIFGRIVRCGGRCRRDDGGGGRGRGNRVCRAGSGVLVAGDGC